MKIITLRDYYSVVVSMILAGHPIKDVAQRLHLPEAKLRLIMEEIREALKDVSVKRRQRA